MVGTSDDGHGGGGGNPVKDLRDRIEAEVSGVATGDAEGAPADRAGDDGSCLKDPLVVALVSIATFYGRPIAGLTLTSGLPLVGGRLPREHVGVACARAGLVSEFSKLKIDRLVPQDLPLIVFSSSGDIDVVWEVNPAGEDGGPAALVSVPGDGAGRVQVPLADLGDGQPVDVLRLRPESSLDERGASALPSKPKSWFLPAFRHCRSIYGQAIAATFAINLLALAMPLFTMNVYDRVLPNAAEATLWALAMGVGLAVLFDFLIRSLRAYFVDAASRSVDVRLSNLIYGRLLGAELSRVPTSAGVRANTMREFETLRDFFNSATLTAFGDLPFLFLFIGVMYVVAGPLAFVVAAAIPIILAIGWLTQRSLAGLIESSFKEAAQKNAVVTESIVGLETIKAGGGESWAAQKWETSVAEHVRTGLKIRHVSNMGQHAIMAVQAGSQVLIVVVGFYLVQAGSLTMGALIAATILSGRAMAPLAQAAGLLARLNQARIAYRTLSEIVQAPQERVAGATYLSKETFEGEVVFEGVNFAYSEDSPPALTDVSLKISPGEHVAFLGSIGSGKTTALKLVQGLYKPDRGRVLIDQVAVSQIEPAQVRRHVGLLLQGADLFHGSIRENITLGAPGIADDAVLRAARTAGALEWIGRLPQGFDTIVRERGVGLSGGQRQSVALARSLVLQPDILLLDEPTSDMDGRTERRVLERLAQTTAGKTVLVVTHRPALLELVQRIIVMDGGQVVADGPKAEVMSQLQAQARGEAATEKTGGAKAVSRVSVKPARGKVQVGPVRKAAKREQQP